MALLQIVIYPFVRTAGALLAGVAALAWMSERTVGQSNALTSFITKAARFAPWFIVVLAGASLLLFLKERRQKKMTTG